jgi:hypothetical protein
MNDLTISDFQACVNDNFTVNFGGEAPLELILENVSPLGRAPEPDEARRQSFSLLFRSDLTDKYLIQQMYEVIHPKLGMLALFLVPMGPGKSGMAYEAVFT